MAPHSTSGVTLSVNPATSQPRDDAGRFSEKNLAEPQMGTLMSPGELPPLNENDVEFRDMIVSNLLDLGDGQVALPVGSPPVRVLCMESDTVNEFSFTLPGVLTGTYWARVGDDDRAFRYGPAEGVTRAEAASAAAEFVVRNTTWTNPTQQWKQDVVEGRLLDASELARANKLHRTLVIDVDAATATFGYDPARQDPSHRQWAAVMVQRAATAASMAGPGTRRVSFVAPSPTGDQVSLWLLLDHDECGQPLVRITRTLPDDDDPGVAGV